MASREQPPPIELDIDVAAIRRSQGLSQREFAARYGLTLATVRNWEQHIREPDRPTQLFLNLVAQWPDVVAEEVVKEQARRATKQ